MTTATLLRALFAAGFYDNEANIPMSIIIDHARDMGVELHPCYGCHQYDGEHSDTCELDICGICGRRGRACVCDMEPPC